MLPYEGSWLFTFADGPHPGPIALTQTGTTGLDGPALELTGVFQTEYDDPAEVVLSVLNASGSVLASATTGNVTTPNLTWKPLPILFVSVPIGAASWRVELRGELAFGTYVNTHFDDLDLQTTPEPTTALLVAWGIVLLGLRTRRSSRGGRRELSRE